MSDPRAWQWVVVIASSLALWALSPRARTRRAFFFGRAGARPPGEAVLTMSLVISWLFAKSITNAANLGLAFGLVGGVAYAGYYLSFAVAGVVLVRLRRAGFAGVHDFLGQRFGGAAVGVFGLLIAVRLFNEVWSNTMVIGSYFGAAGTLPYYAAVGVFTALTLAYSLRGGMAASLLTDVVQFALFGVLLAVVLAAVLPGLPAGGATTGDGAALWGEWSLAGGLDLLLVALVQSLSYPFHDPVLTDRAFVGEARDTRRAFLRAAPLGAAGIVLFSFVGVYGRAAGVEGEAAVGVARLLGPGLALAVNLIMVTSAASTLDSALASWSKFAVWERFGRDAGGVDARPVDDPSRPTVTRGRWAMVALAVLGSVPVLLDAAVLSATTVSGLMVVGLAPVFLLWREPAPALSFHLAVGVGLVFGIAYAADVTFGLPPLGGGAYGGLLTATLVATALACAGFLVPRALHASRS